MIKIWARRKEIETYIILFFALYMLSIFADITPKLLPYQEVGAMLFRYLAFIFVILHALEKLGKQETIMFFSITLSLSFISEYLGVTHGLIFGKYAYHDYTNMILGLVPWQTPLSWSVIIYICYQMTNLFLKGFGGEKFKLTNSFFFLTLLSSIDGLIAVNIDMILDPVCTNIPNPSWTWENTGPYFGIPITNFIGWFVVTFVATIIFRIYELTIDKGLNDKIRWLDFTPVAVYGTYMVRYVIASLNLGYIEYALVGITTMMPFIMLASVIFLIKTKSRRSRL